LKRTATGRPENYPGLSAPFPEQQGLKQIAMFSIAVLL